jgi:hypothetical protein
MVVTGVQAAGAKGVTAVQGAVVDGKDSARTAPAGREPVDATGAPVRRGEPQPVVFPRRGVPVDPRPIELRRQYAQARYRSYGGDHDEAA